jgi:predicted type IV restriction endonuclease
MALRDQLPTIRARPARPAELLTEEATKNALVMPTLRALDYDVFDPSVVVPEFTADFGVKKGEKVDYAIRMNGDVQILIECKPAQTDLATAHASQLYRYFSVTKAKFSILTNGIEWRFFTDLDAPNKMDDKPLFIFSILEYNDQYIVELEKFSAANFSINGIVAAASDLKLKSLITEALRKEFTSPSDDFVRIIGRRVRDGNMTAEVRARFATFITSCIADIMRDQANQRLKDAIERTPERIAVPTPTPVPTATAPSVAPEVPTEAVRTTAEELDAFRIIQAILRKDLDVGRIVMRDAASYCAILCDDNNRKPIARLYLEGKKKRIGIFDNKTEQRFDIVNLDEIYNYAEQLQAAVRPYLAPAAAKSPASSA